MARYFDLHSSECTACPNGQ